MASITFSVVQDSLKTDANSGTSFSLISKDLGYINSMIKRHFSDFAWEKLKNQNKDSTAFHVARCSPLHNSKPKSKLSIKCTPKHGSYSKSAPVHDTEDKSILVLDELSGFILEMKSNILSSLKFEGQWGLKFWGYRNCWEFNKNYKYKPSCQKIHKKIYNSYLDYVFRNVYHNLKTLTFLCFLPKATKLSRTLCVHVYTRCTGQ